MESLKIRSHIGEDGCLQVIMPPHFHNTEVEVTMTIKTVNDEAETVNKKDINQISEEFRQLRQNISPDTLSIRAMIEEGRRF